MQTYIVERGLVPQVIEVLTEKNVEAYTVSSEGDACVVCSEISAREMKRTKRAAWAMKLSKKIGLPVITREDIGNLRTGVIPEKEKHWFEKARL
jgi:hypothetical protein